MLPTSLANCRWLEVVDIGNNEIQDTFPFWMESLPKLRVLVLRSNKFYGTVLSPVYTNASFPKLQVFDIAQNAFTCPLPERYLNSFTAMIDAKDNATGNDNWFARYDESIQVVFKGSEYELRRILTTFTTIDMSHNHFTGAIPGSIGKLNSLRYLNLSHNNLTGHIPSSLGNMIMLESLDLSWNQLDGEIPTQFANLSSLGKLNLSMNNLSGPIPQPRHFDTFGNDSFIGNQGLCGIPLTKKCDDDKGLDSPPLEDDDSGFLDGLTWEIVVMGYGCGLVAGVTLGYIFIPRGWLRWLEESFLGIGHKKRTRSRRRNEVKRRRRNEVKRRRS